ncbi:MAG: hypothetical protein H6658_01185 [Ardenticatenaceae bacterium]|nr:hypothetical protein [Ardenticatenaceae bacterium]
MSETPVFKQPQALEAIAHDTVSFMSLLLGMKDHSQSGLLAHGLLPPASMYIVESYNTLKKLAPDVADTLLEELATQVQPTRHRAKLLDNPEKSVEQVANELAEVSQRQTQFFMKPHTGFWGILKRAIQPDLGLSIYDEHVFSTTHATAFSFGDDRNISTKAFAIGKAIGAYTTTLVNLFGLPMPTPTPLTVLSGTIKMRDIKSSAFYKRGLLGNAPIELATGMTLLLVNLNYMRYIMQPLLPVAGHTQFRLKFIVAYHADSNIGTIQNQLRSSSSIPKDTVNLLGDALGNPDSRWLRKKSILRNLLVHYAIEEKLTTSLKPEANRLQTIEHFGGKSFSEIDALLDRHIERMSLIFEEGFSLAGDPFWYGHVT